MDCPACHRTAEPSARFCSNCGEPLGLHDGAPARSGERRWLTVMFCDVVDSTVFSGRVDPEVYGECMLAYQELGAEVVAQHGGHVAGYLGDGLLVFFGWPKAQERDADLAVLAGGALLARLESLNDELEQRHRVRLAARIGIHSGLAVVGRMGGAGRTDTAGFGDAINVAARIENVAAPGTIAISSETKLLLRDRWTLRSLGHPLLKGVMTGLEVFQVLGAEGPSGPDVERVGPLVGRDAEAGALRSLWYDTVRGTGAMATLVGESGVGKSRLAYELQQVVEPYGRWVTLQCMAMSADIPFSPFGPIVEQLQLVEGRSPEERRADLFEGLIEWAVALAQDRPGVLHVEDVHWADPSTEELLERMADQVERRPLLVLCTRRPTGLPSWTKHPVVRTLPLGPLAAADIRSLVDSIAKGLLSPSVIDDIVERADGVPLFADQLVAGMLTAPTWVVPATLQASLMARLDQLGAELRTVTQRASAIGRTFSDDLLQALMGPSVDTRSAIALLVDADIIVREGEGRHRFRHALLQEAAHESMLRRERRSVHDQVARLLRENFPAEVDREPAVMGHHLAEAADSSAATWFQRAGTRAARAAAFEEAARHFRRALELLGPDDRGAELRLQIELANAMFGGVGYAAADTLPVWGRAQELAEALGNTEELTSALNGEATYWLQAGSCRKSIDVAQRILELAESQDVRIGRLRAHCTLALDHLFLGNGPASQQHADLAIASYRPGDFEEVTYGIGTDQGVIGYGVGGAAAWMTGHPDRGIQMTAAAVELGVSVGSAISELLGRVFKAVVHHLRGEHDLARTEASKLVNDGTRFRLPFMTGFGHILLGTQRAILDADADGVVEVLTGMEQLATTGGQNGAPLAFALLAEAQLSVNDGRAGLASASGGIALAEAFDQHFIDAELRRLEAKAMLLLANASNEALVGHLRAAVDDAVARGLFGLALRVACDIGDLSPRVGRPLIAGLVPRIDGGGSTSDCRRAHQLLGSNGWS